VDDSINKPPRLGRYVTTTVAGEPVKAFVPPPLPPADLDLGGLHQHLDRANQALGRLDGLTVLLPDVRFLLYLYVRKEALLSSQIEGTQSSFVDVLLFENKVPTNVPKEDVEEVSNYVAAMQHGLRRLHGGFPLSLRLIREIHAILLRGGRGANRTPGEFRRSQNWIGGSRPGNASFVPPPPAEMMECLDRFERFLHDEKHRLPLLVEAGLVHVQFESIHPFLDGNGRLGRLLITLLLCAKRALKEPLLYLSLYFKTHRSRYYDLLQRVRTDGAWEEWLQFFWRAWQPRLRKLQRPQRGFSTCFLLIARRYKNWGALPRLHSAFTSICSGNPSPISPLQPKLLRFQFPLLRLPSITWFESGSWKKLPESEETVSSPIPATSIS
jgi:Fic family protein